MDKKRRAGILLLQIAVSLGLLAYLFWRIDDGDGPASLLSDIPEWSLVTGVWLAAALFLTFMSFVAGALRWESAVEALGMKESFSNLFAYFMAGQFTSNFLPTTIGGDILRVARLNKTVKDTPNSFASVVIDRMGGWIALPVICLVGLAWNGGLRQLGAPSSTALLVSLATLGVLALIIYSVGHGATGRWLGRRKGALRYMHALHLGFDSLKGKPKDTIYLVFSALLYQFVLVLAVACAAEALGIDEIGLTAVMAFLPVVLIVQALPISIGGLGVRESLFVFFLTQLGVTDSEATLLGLFVGALVLTCSLPGVIPLVFGGGKPKSRPADLSEEVNTTLEALDAEAATPV